MDQEETPSVLRESGSVRIKAITLGYLLPVILVLHAIGSQMGAASSNQFIRRYVKLHVNENECRTFFNISEIKHNECMNSTENEIQREAADWILYIEIIEHGFGIIAIILIAIFSDRVGRKPFMVISLLGKALEYGFSFFIVRFKLPLFCFFVSAFLSGICGMNYGFSLACSAAVADTSRFDKSRSFNLALIGLYVSIGLCVSQVSTGYIIKWLGYDIPLLVSAFLHFVCVILLKIFMKETLVIPNELQDTTVSDHKCEYFRNIIAFYYDQTHLRDGRIWKFNLCIFAFLVVVIPLSSMAGVEVLYELGSPFSLTSASIGWIGATKDFTLLIIGTLLLKVLHRYLNDEIIAVIGCVSGVCYFLVMAFATHEWMIYTAIACGLLSYLPLPVISGILSKMVKSNRQGALFANTTLMQTIGRLLGVTAFMNIFANTQSMMEGFVYLVCVIFNLVCVSLLLPVVVSNRRIRTMGYLTIN